MTEMMRKPVSICLLLLALVTAAAWVPSALAQGGDRGEGQIVMGRDVDLEAGQVVDGDLSVFGGNLRMAANSRVTGDVAVFGGYTEIAGNVGGDVAAIGGNIRLNPTARVDGDIFTLGGRVQKDAGAQVMGKQTALGRFDLGRFLPRLGGFGFRFAPPRWAGSDVADVIWHLMRAAVVSMALAVVGLLLVLFLSEHAAVIGRAVTNAAAPSFGVGLLTLFLGAALIVVLLVTVCLAPIGLLVGLPLALASLVGWAVVGYLLGQRLMPLLNKQATPAPAVTALVGVLVLTAVQQGLMVLGQTPCLGFMFWLIGAATWLVVTSLGLGAVVLTRFGTRPYPGPTPAHGPYPPAPTIAPAVTPVGPAPEGAAGVMPGSMPQVTVSDTAPAKEPAPEEAPAPASEKDSPSPGSPDTDRGPGPN
jgi:cytoskeletal protein CcmA (bactofilin family)